jgi:hypothetical protein
MVTCCYNKHMGTAMLIQRYIVLRFCLPARSLRGLTGLTQSTIDWWALLTIRPAISGIESLFLPALREASGVKDF